MDSSVNPQPDEAHIRINHEIHREIIRRKFTQRQRDIIDFILTLSWGCGKPSAIIPMLKYFELCGVLRTHVKKELQRLVEAHVILWEESMSVFQINKHYDQWSVEIVEAFDKKTMSELIKINIQNDSPNLSKPVTKCVTQLPKRELKKVTKKVTQLPNVEPQSYQMCNSTVTKKVTLTRDYPSHIKAFRLSKTIFKAIKKERRTRSKDLTETKSAASGSDFSFSRIYQAYQKNFTRDDRVTDFDVEEINILYDDFGGEWFLDAMKEAFRHNIKTLAYVRGVLNGYRKRGGPTKEIQPLEMITAPSVQSAILDESDPITQLMRRAGELQSAQH
jgi:DnaD/phage-associated family protein